MSADTRVDTETVKVAGTHHCMRSPLQALRLTLKMNMQVTVNMPMHAVLLLYVVLNCCDAVKFDVVTTRRGRVLYTGLAFP